VVKLLISSSSRLVCYYNSLAEERAADGKFTVSDIDPYKCTHLIYAFSDINTDNELVPTSAADIPRYHSFNELKTSNQELKTLLSVGGITFNKQKFSGMVGSVQQRQAFIQSAIELLRQYGFDGLNIDWRFPESVLDKQGFTSLCQDLKDGFQSEAISTGNDRLLITASVSPEKDAIDAGYEVAEISASLDFINVLTFDFHGPWEGVTGHHSPLYRGSQDTGDQIYSNTDSAMQYWMDQGAPAPLLNLGLAAYGRAFNLSSLSTDVGAPANGAGEEGCYTGEDGFWAYYEGHNEAEIITLTCLYTEGATVQLITDQMVPYAVTENQWVGFDNRESLGTKVSYLREKNFGGAVVWSLDLDDFDGKFCNQSDSPFISHLNDLILTPNTITTTIITPTTTQTLTTTQPLYTMIPTTIQSTTTTTTPGYCIDNDDGIYPNPDDIFSFLQCTNKETVVHQCQPGLRYRANCTCCDWR
uniref:chitinase n=1 Tax=Cynoglossus semilaevis TaxID=244447 RepID=A0A3P8WZC8_CYNSE